MINISEEHAKFVVEINKKISAFTNDDAQRALLVAEILALQMLLQPLNLYGRVKMTKLIYKLAVTLIKSTTKIQAKEVAAIWA